MIPSYRLREKTILSNINRLVHLLIELSHRKGDAKTPYINEAVRIINSIRPLLLNLTDGKEEHLEPLIRQLVSQKLPPVWSSFGDLHNDLNNILAKALQSHKEENLTSDDNAIINEEECTTTSEKEDSQETTEQTIEEENSQETVDDHMMVDNAMNDVITSEEDSQEIVQEVGFHEQVEQIEEVEQTEQVEQIEQSEEIIADTCPQDIAEENIQMDKAQEEHNDPFETLGNIIKNVYDEEKIIKDYRFRNIIFNYYLPDKNIGVQIVDDEKPIKQTQKYLLQKQNIKLIQVCPHDLNNMYQLIKKLRSV